MPLLFGLVLISIHSLLVSVVKHQSSWDLRVLDCMESRRRVSRGTKNLKWTPLFGQIYWLAGDIRIDRDNAVIANAVMLRTTAVMQ